MFKSFIVSLLPFAVIAKGDNNGLGRDNAFTATLIDTEDIALILHLYNARDHATEQNELHGDIDLQLKTKALSNQ